MGEFFIITTQLFASFFMTAQKQANDITPNKTQSNNSSNAITGEIERHPFEPFLPKNAKLLMLGSFPPAEHRWTMHFYILITSMICGELWALSSLMTKNTSLIKSKKAFM